MMVSLPNSLLTFYVVVESLILGHDMDGIFAQPAKIGDRTLAGSVKHLMPILQ